MIGVTQSDYQEWKHHPVSKVFRKYLEDYRAEIRKEILSQWEAGSLVAEVDKEARGRVLQLTDILDLEFSAIQQFYQHNEEEADNGASSRREDT